MLTKRVLQALFIFILVPLVAGAAVQQQKAPDLKLSGEMQAGKVLLRIAVPDGFYTYRSSPYANPLKLTIAPLNGLRFGKPELPDGKIKGKERILTGKFNVTVPVYGKRTLDEATLQITADYQLCEAAAGVCHMPQQTVLKLKGRLQPAAGNAAQQSGGGGVQGLLQRHLDTPVWAFLIAVVAGLLASLTPCVYPVIPITVGYFSKQGDGSRRTRLVKALVYVAGMSLVYTLLGVIAGLTGSMFAGWVNKPGFFLVVGVLFTGLALSMFELYEIKMPAALAGLKQSGSGHSGAFLMGILTGLVASPCVGPVVFFLLTGVLQAGQPFYGALLMSGFSLGMGLLFLLLAVFSQKALHLPRSGNWMVRIKIVLGVLVLGSAVYFVTLALRSWNVQPVLQIAVTLLLVVFAGGAGAVTLRRLYGAKPRHGVFLAVLAALLLAFSLFSWQAEKGLDWPGDPRQALQQAAAQNKPVFMDLYADWCGICREMEKELLKQPALLKFLRENYITVKVNFDRHKEYLQKHYGVRSLPWVLILDRNGKQLWKKAGFNDAAAFVRQLQRVTAQYAPGAAADQQ